MARRSSDREAIEAEIDHVRSLGLDALRALWRTMLRSSPPPAFTKDLTARFLCWHIQEQAFGGLDSATAQILDAFANGDRPATERRLKLGTVLVREYQGQRHTVTVVPGGYAWGDTIYTSLSTIARTITGTAWNGPRFFGLRARANRPQDIDPEHASHNAGAGDARPRRGRNDSASPRRGQPSKKARRSC